MFKKFLSLAIAIMIVMSMAAIAASAAQVEISENAADTPAEVGADSGADTGAESGADSGAESGADTAASGSKIYFDATPSGWGNYSVIMVYCYCPEDGSVQIDWGSKKKGGMTDEGNGIWSYDFAAKNISLDSSKQYSLIFNADTGVQTHDLLFDTSLYGDTAVPEAGKEVENPADSNKNSTLCKWKSGKLGPALCITSLGHVVPESGGVIPAHTTAYEMFVNFLAATDATGLMNALNFQTDKTAQQLIDETAAALGLKKGDVEAAIKEAAKPDGDRTDSYDWSGDWDASKSTLSDGTNEDAHKNPESGVTDDGGNGGGSDDGGDDSGDTGSEDGGDDGSEDGGTTGGGSSADGGSGGSGGSGGASGSGSGSKTGQETTVLYIMLATMVAAAGVIFFVRRKDRT